MKRAAVKALAELAQLRRDGHQRRGEAGLPGEKFDFGPHYIIPKPFDPRVLLHVAPAVAQAAMESDVARVKIDLDEYRSRLEGISRELARA